MKVPTSRGNRLAFPLICLLVMAAAAWFAFSPRPRDADSNSEPAAADATGHDRDQVPAVEAPDKEASRHDRAAASLAEQQQPQQTALPAHAPEAINAPLAKRRWERDFFTSRSTAAVGSPIQFELTGGVTATGRIRHVEYVEGSLIYVSGELSTPEQGRFFFQKQLIPGKQGDFVGLVELPRSKRAWRIEPSGPDGVAELVERQLDEVICLLPPPAEVQAEMEEIPPLDPSDVPDYVPPHNDGIISLQSLPGAAAVLYIDYRGGFTPTWGGIDYSRPGVSNGQIKDVWKRVAEDYMPFNINVTTDSKVFDAATPGRRQRCIVTNTTTAAPGAGGVSYLGSWNWGGDTPNWAFNTTGSSAALAISHECGHALGLNHDGRTSPSEGYYGGHGSGSTGWGPLMGAPYGQAVTQWSKGDYANANNTEDDLSKIVSNNNSVDYRADDTGNTLATARYLEVYANQSASAEGVIETTGDIDAFRFSTKGGNVTLRVDPASGDWANLAIMATLADSAGNVITSNNDGSRLWASVSANLAAGTYTLQVVGVGRGAPPYNTGFSNYASLGYYSVSGTVANAVPMTYLSIAENSANGTPVGTVDANNPNSDPLVYSIVSGNTGNVFTIANNGQLTVANGTPLNYEALALGTQYTVQYELFVNITNTVDPALSETNRRVVVKVTDVNEAPTGTGFSTSIYANSQPGTLLGTVAGSTPDFYTAVSFAIAGGNPNNAFAIDPASGVVTVSGSLPTSLAGNHVLSVVVSAGSLSTTANVNITVLPGYSGVWANAAGGSWATAANWAGNVVAGGVGETADFSTLNLTASRVVNLDGNRMIGSLLFGDTDPSASWTINPGSGGTLTMNAPGTPTLTVNNQSATLTTVVAGSRGLIKNGAGTLIFTGANTYSGPTTVDSGKLVFRVPSNADWTIPSGVTIASGATATIDFTAQTTQYRKTTLGTNIINAGGVLELTGTNNDINDWYLINSWTASGGGTIRVLNGAVSCWTGSSNALAGFAGLIDIPGGQFSANVSNSTTLGGSFDVNVGPGGKLDLRSGHFTIDALTGSGAVIKSWSGDTLTFTLGSNNGSGSWSGSMAGTNFNLVKTGTGIQTLGGSAISYPGTTTVNQGTLMLSSTTAFASAVTVNAGGSFGGTGNSSAPVTVNTGGTLIPGSNGIGTLSINSALTLSGTVNAEINRTAGSLDRIQGVSTLTYGGILNVTNLSGTLTANDTFALFGATNYSGSFSLLNLPPLDAGLTWDLSSLPVNGSIKVVDFTGVDPPATPPTGVTATAVSASQIDLTWTAVGGATTYGVSRDGSPLATTSGTSFSDTGLTMGTTYSYTVKAINTGGSSAPGTSVSATTPFVGVTLAWDANPGSAGAQDGNGTWNNTATNWWHGTANQSWANGNAVTFGIDTAANCTVTLVNDVTPTGLTFNPTAGGTYTISGSGGIYLSGSIPILTNANAALNAVLKGGGGLVKSGPATLSLGASNPYTGSTIISSGTLAASRHDAIANTGLQLGDANTGANATGFKIANGVSATMNLASITTTPYGSGHTITLDAGSALGGNTTALACPLILAGPVPLTLRATNTGGHSSAQDWTGRITGTGIAAGSTALVIDGSSSALRLTWGGTTGTTANDFTGDVIIKGSVTTQGTTYSGATANRQNLGFINNNVTVNPSTTWTIVWGGETVGALNGSGNIVLNNQNALNNTGLTLGNNSANGSFTGAISGGYGLLKTGSGTQIFSGNSTYSGATHISGGSLLINGSLGNTATVVNAAGTLGGTGTLAGTVTNNGTLAPGTLAPGNNAIGNLTVTNTLTLAADSKLVWEIGNWTGTPGTGWDKLTVSSLNITATSANRVVIRPVGLALANFSEVNASFTLVQSNTPITGFSADKFDVDLSGLILPQGTWAIQQSGNTLVLAYTANTNPDRNANGILDTWETARFGSAQAGANPPNEDPDHDGLSNLLEYALDTHPLTAGASPLNHDLEIMDDGSYLRLIVPKNPAATNLIYIVETCDEFGNWSALNTTIEVNTATQLVVRDNFSTTTASRRFIRLRVQTAS